MRPFRVLQISIMVLMLFGSTLIVRAIGLSAAPSGQSSTWLASTAAIAGPLQADNADNSGDGENSDDNSSGGDNSDNSSSNDNSDSGNDNSGNDNYDDDSFTFELPPPEPTRPPQPTCANPGQETVFTSYDEKVAVRVFPNTPQPVRIEILQIIDFLSAPLPPGNLVGLLAYEIRASTCDGVQLSQLPAEMNLGIRYTDLEATGLDETRFVIGRLDLATATWVPVEKRANDPASNFTSATISEPGYYMVWESRQP